jgi:DNA-binding response OmpR family regulator
VWRGPTEDVVASVILVVEDETKIRDLVRGYLEREGHQVVSTASGAEAIELVRAVEPALVVLDLRLPDVPGEEVARELRAFSSVPILMLTAKVSEEDRIHGLELGADDYVTKPFSPRELLLRVRAILRRSPRVDEPTRSRTFGGGRLTVDEDRHEACVDGRLLDLTPTEWRLLLALANAPGRVYSRYELVNRVRGLEFDGYERTIDTHVKNLRRKLGDDPQQPLVIETVVGAGYRLGLSRDG